MADVRSDRRHWAQAPLLAVLSASIASVILELGFAATEPAVSLAYLGLCSGLAVSAAAITGAVGGLFRRDRLGPRPPGPPSPDSSCSRA